MQCKSLDVYLNRYGPLLADRARQAFEPLHVPGRDATVKLNLARPMLPAQAHVVTAAMRTLQTQKAIFIAAECGTGKTCMGACIVHAHAAGKPYNAIAMVPPHLVEIWRAELSIVFPAGSIDIRILNDWRELLRWPRERPARPTWLIISETTAKLGASWKPAAVGNPIGILRCPTCGGQLRNTKDKNKGNGSDDGGNFLTWKDLSKSRKFCTNEVFVRQFSHCLSVESKADSGDSGDGDSENNGGGELLVKKVCGSPLWTYTNERGGAWAPAEYVHKHMSGVFQYLIADECHEEKSETSARANALGALAASVNKVIGMTGTLIGGKANHIRPLLFRLSPQSLRAEGLTWEDSMEFSRRYGRVDTVIVEKSGFSDSDNRNSKGKTTKTQKEQPGIMPTLYGRHLIGNTIFLGLGDVAESLPSYTEHLVSVPLSPDMEEPYRKLEKKLKHAVADLLKRGNHGLLGTMLNALLAYPDYPYDWKTLGYVDHKDGDQWVSVVTPKALDRNTQWEKEKKLLEILATEKAQGRQCWVFCVYTHTHPVLERLAGIVQRAGFSVRVLDAAAVPTRKRSKWIADNAKGIDVLISHPKPVGTGLTLFDAAGNHNFPSLIFYETGYDLFALRQASRRSWRIGQKKPCRVYFMYYQETMQARAMGLMATKLDAALALEGQFSSEGLAAMSATSGSMAMELAKSLVENIDFGNAERTWRSDCGHKVLGLEATEATEATATEKADVFVESIEGDKWICVTFTGEPGQEIVDAMEAAGFIWLAPCWVGDRERLPDAVLSLAMEGCNTTVDIFAGILP